MRLIKQQKFSMNSTPKFIQLKPSFHTELKKRISLYFETTGKNIKGTSGTIEVTNIDNTNNTISGTFTVTGDDNGTTYKITEGNFENVPLK